MEFDHGRGLRSLYAVSGGGGEVVQLCPTVTSWAV